MSMTDTTVMVEKEQQTPNRMAELRERKGWMRPELARRMGTSAQQVERLEKGQRNLTQKWMERAAAALECDIVEILRDTRVGYTPPPNAEAFRMEGASAERMHRDLPIFGTALGASRIVDGEAIEQTTLNSGEIVAYAKRPPILNGRADAYGLYVMGSSMYPVYPEGTTILAERKRPPRVGDDVVVYLRPEDALEDDGERARMVLVKRLVRRSATYVELHQFTPDLTFRIPRDSVLRIDRVLTLSDLIE